MTFPFDHKLPAPLAELVENTILTKLEHLRRQNGGFLEALEASPFRIHDDASWDLASQVVRGRAPAVLVSVLDSDRKAATTMRGRVMARYDVVITAVSMHKLSFVDGRMRMSVPSKAGTVADPGCRAVLELCYYALNAQDLDIPGVKELQWQGTSEIRTQPEITGWASLYHLEIEHNTDWAKGVTTMLEELHTSMHVTTAQPTEGPVVEVVTESPAP